MPKITKKKRSKYPGYMSFNKALGLNPSYGEYGGWLDILEYQDGGTLTSPKQFRKDQITGNAVPIKSAIAYGSAFGNPSVKRMVAPVDNPYIFKGDEPYTTPDMKGEYGTHYMFSEGNYAIPTIQQGLDGLFYNEQAGPMDREAIRFNRPVDADRFATRYKEFSPAFKYQEGGKIPSEDNAIDLKQIYETNPIVSQYLDKTADFEGFKNKPYDDGRGFLTIGYGFNLDAPGAKSYLKSKGYNYADVRAGKAKISEPEYKDFLMDKMYESFNIANKKINNFTSLPTDAQYIVTDMIYNLGPSKFDKFKQLKKALNNKDYSRAADEIVNSLYYNQTGRRSRAHVNTLRSMKEFGGWLDEL